MKTKHVIQILLLITLWVYGLGAIQAAEKINFVEPAKPYDASPVLKTPIGKVDPKKTLQVPLIAWSADGLLIDMNKGLGANPSSPLGQAVGQPVGLKIQNIVDDQVADYISGKSPFFRGTSGQVALIAAALKKLDPNLEPITFIQLSRSTGADAFVSKPLADLSALKGKTLITQLSGPHPEIIATMLRDGGLQPTDVTLKYVRDITDPTWKAGAPINDPANAFRNDPTADGVTVIDVDALGLTGGATGTGADGTVKDAKTVFSTKTAPNIIFDVIAVRKDFLVENPKIVENLRKAHLAAQDAWLKDLEGLKNKSKAQKKALLDRTQPMAKELLGDPGLSGDFLVWLAEGSELAGSEGNKSFFKPGNPNGFDVATERVQSYYQALGLIDQPMKLTVNKPFPDTQGAATPAPVAKKTFTDEQAVRQAASSKDANIMYRYTFQFSPQESTVNWKDYPEIFEKIHDTVTRYGGAIIQIRGHGDNFFYRFAVAKRGKGEMTYQTKDKVTGEFSAPIPIPDPVQILNDSNALSYTRAFNVKSAYAKYVKESLGQSSETIDLSRFDIKGMGLSEPVIANPKSGDDRAKNMRCEIVIIAAESELPSDLSIDDLK
jgi:hypothetical protein